MGVRRAVELALDAPSKSDGPIYTFGPLIHNPQVLALFAEKGVSILDKIPEEASGTVLVRAHGIAPGTHRRLKDAGFKVINATCPRVIKVQSIIKGHARKKYDIIIVGDQDHPEVIGLLGYAAGRGVVVPSLKALTELPRSEQAIIVAQTTQNICEYDRIRAWAAQERPHYKFFNTICDSTQKRQAEVRRLAQDADAVVVVGGKESGNTRRLASIVKVAGKPAYHVESEQGLDIKSLSRMKKVGITAGASTPSWIIKRVMTTLEQISLHGKSPWRACWLRLRRIFLLTNIYVALGAGCLTFATSRLQGLPAMEYSVAVAVLYTMSMHILNHLTGKEESKYNDPYREKFYRSHKVGLTLMALAAGSLGLAAAIQMGAVAFWVLLCMSLLGLSYNLRIVPHSMAARLKFSSLRDIPGSKTILIALAWGIVTAGLPFLAAGARSWLSGLLAMTWATGIVFCRTAFFDILDIQGDRIVGKETLPILIGSKKSFKLLQGLLLLILLLLPLSGSLGLLSPLAFLLMLPPLLLLVIISTHQHGSPLPGIGMQFKVESLFVLCGALGILCSLVSRLCFV